MFIERKSAKIIRIDTIHFIFLFFYFNTQRPLHMCVTVFWNIECGFHFLRNYHSIQTNNWSFQ